MMGTIPLTLCLTVLAQNPNWPVQSLDSPTSELSKPENQPDDPEYFDPDLCKGQFGLFGFHPNCAAQRNPEEEAQGVGIHVDQAWSVTIGKPNIIIGVLVDDVSWGDVELVNRWSLNQHELPVPAVPSDADTEEHDRNRDGVFNVLDYTSVTGTAAPSIDTIIDENLLLRPDRGDANKNGILDPEDLTLIYSDEQDNDRNGKVDDICGWDFVEADPYVSSSTKTDEHINASIRIMAAEANNNVGLAGACPKCSVLPLRTGAAKDASVYQYLRAMRYGASRGAKIFPLQEPPTAANPTQTTSIADAMSKLASENRVIIVDPGTSHKALYPSSWTKQPALVVGGLSRDHVQAAKATTFSQSSPCKNFGPEIDFSTPGDCNTESLSLAAGAIGLLLSASDGIAERGINLLQPPLSTSELKHILRSTAVPTFSNSSDDSFRKSGYGKINVRSALSSIIQRNIPVPAQISYPLAFEHINATFGEPFMVSGRIENMRHPSAEWKIEYAIGIDAAAEDFEPVAQGVILKGETIDATTEIPSNGLFSDVTSPPFAIGTHALSIRITTNVDVNGSIVRSEDRLVIFVHSDLYSWPTFPKKFSVNPVGSAVLIDVNGDNSEDIVFLGDDNKLHAVTAEMKPLSGFPAMLRTRSAPKYLAVSPGPQKEQNQIIIGTDDGEIESIGFDGQASPNFPVSFVIPTGIPHAPLIFDIDNDERPEIFVASSEGVVIGWNASGKRLNGFPLSLGNVGPLAAGYFGTDRKPGIIGGNNNEILIVQEEQNVFAARSVASFSTDSNQISKRRSHMLQPLLVDLDRDLSDEIVFSSQDGRIYVSDLDDTEPKTISVHSRSSLGADSKVPTLGNDIFAVPGFSGLSDLDQDGTLELVTPATTIDDENHKDSEEIDPLEYLVGAWNLSSGNHSPGFPLMSGAEVDGPIAIVDLDGDGRPEVIFEDGYFRLQAVSSAGVSPPGWPKRLDGPLAGPLAFGDVDNNGELEVCATTTAGSFFIWRTSINRNSSLDWPYPRHNLQHTANPRTVDFSVQEKNSDSGCNCQSVDVEQPSPLQLLYVGALLWFISRRFRHLRTK